MHILGILFIVLILGVLFSPLDSVGARLYDRRRVVKTEPSDQPSEEQDR